MARRRRGVLRHIVLVGALVFGGALALVSGTTAQPTRAEAAQAPVYYLALGDSLAYGIGATTPASGYVNDIYLHEAQRIEGLQLVNLGCPGATTTSMLDGPGCSSGTQLAAAQAFLEAHPGQVAFATIDIGANDIEGCQSGTTIDLTCADDAFSTIATNLPEILSGLTQMYPGLPIFGMNYYDPFLAVWLTGSAGPSAAEESETLLGQLNNTLSQAYGVDGLPTADVATAFASTDFNLTGTYDGLSLPQNVANICNWTLMCTEENIHANDTGHALIASAFEPLIDAAIAATVCDPATVTSASTATATAGSTFAFTVSTCTSAVPQIKASSLPPGLRATNNEDGTATIAGTPGPHDSGPYNATVTVSVKGQPAVTQPLVLTVDNAPVFRGKATATLKTGIAFSFPITTVYGYPSPRITTSSMLPEGVSLTDNDNGTASFSGTPGPAAGGMYPFTVSATNDVGAPVSKSGFFTVDQAPQITSSSTDSIAAATAMAPFTVTATGYPIPGLRATGLPSGLHFTNNHNLTASISGTTHVAPGSYPVTITASGKAGVSAQAFTLTVNP